jgi:sulfotransferase family protein
MSSISGDSADEGRRPIYIYIVGRGHSGSTLLAILLGRHAKISSMGEIANLSLQCYRDHRTRWPGTCSCGARPFDCPVWGSVIQDIHRQYGKDLRESPFSWRVSDVGLEEEHRKSAVWKSPLFWASNRSWRALRHLQYGTTPVLASVARLYQPQKRWIGNRSFVAERVADHFMTEAVVDASKDYLGMRDLVGHSPLPVKVLFITRDPRGNAWSTARAAKSAADRLARLRKGCREWNTVNGRIRNLLRDTDPSMWMQVKYENLCRKPEQTLRELLSFIGLPYADSILQGEDENQHTIAGNKIRLRKDRLEIREDNAWRDNFDERELTEIRERCSALGSHLDYDFSD